MNFGVLVQYLFISGSLSVFFFWLFGQIINKLPITEEILRTKGFNKTVWLASKEPNTACTFDIRLYLTPLGQARQFIETCGAQNLLCGRKFVYF
jgi:hypothetical protein